VQISEAGIKALEAREGVRLKAYPDSRGIWTIGVGHTGGDVHPGAVITPAEVDILLKRDLGWSQIVVESTIKKPMAQNQFDAFVSIAFNIGPAGFHNSTFARWFNLGYSPQAVASAIMHWCEPREVIPRRKSETAQFLAA
jgi:lysozyme